MRKGDRLTIKQKMFAHKYVEKRNGTQAALEVYNSKSRRNAKLISTRLMKKPLIQAEIKSILDQVGLTAEHSGKYLKDAIVQGLESGKATVGDSLRGLDMVFKLSNAYPASKSIKMSYSRVDQTVSKDMKEVAETLKKLNEATSRLLASTEQVAQ